MDVITHVQLQFRLKPETADWLAREAEARMVSRNLIVERALSELRDRLDAQS
jgi:predicted transcriptional regulator